MPQPNQLWKQPGDKNCPLCRGSGYVPNNEGSRPFWDPPRVTRCTCLHEKDMKRNLENVWRGLSLVAPFPKGSPLVKYLDKNLHLIACRGTLTRHLSSLGRAIGPHWSCKVQSDADLITAWLANVAIKGQEIFDADASRVSSQYISLVDLAVPPGLLVLYLGIKTAPNKEMPQVFLEALQERAYRGKPTWVVSDKPLDSNHRCWSESVHEFLSDWKVLTLKAPKVKPEVLPEPDEMDVADGTPKD